MQQQPHLEILGRTRAQAPALKNLFALSAWCCLCAPLSAQPVSTRVEAIAGTPWKRHTIDNTSQGADGVKLGDWNRDGLPDITTGWEEGGLVRVYTNPGGLKARDPRPQITVGDVADVEEAIFADLDGDGRLEVISGTEGKTRTIFWHRPIGRKWRTDAFPATKNIQMWMQAAAVDLDGLTDLAVAVKPFEIFIFLRQQDGGWREKVLQLDAGNPGRAKAVRLAMGLT
jgi:hypothetical protein